MKGSKAYMMAMDIHKKMYEYPSELTSAEKEKLYEEYFLLIKKSAYYGNIEAQYDLAQQYESMSFLGLSNPRYNPRRCIFWYSKACELGHAEACNNLAAFYEMGEGCERDLEIALDLYKKSANLGSLNGKKNLKIMQKDLLKGGKYYRVTSR
jgi:TPR repeat protein